MSRYYRFMAVCVLTVALSLSGVSAQQGCHALVDTIGTLSVNSTYPVPGSGGLTVSIHQVIGPRLILTQPTTITEIGAIANSAFPLSVQIRPSLNGAPDPTVVLFSFSLSFDNDPGIYSYESVKVNLVLQPGTYFVLFVSQPDEQIGALLHSHFGDPPLLSGSTATGSLDLTTGVSQFSDAEFYAVRILGCGPFDLCIQDDSDGSLLQINTTTGDYQFSNCAGLIIGGTGTITRRGSLVTLQHATGDRRVTAYIDQSTSRATASVQSLLQGRTYTITDRNITNNTCVCR